MNNKAQVQYGLLFLVAVGLCVFAGKAMLSFTENLDFQSAELSQMLYEADFNKRYVTEQTKILAEETIQNCPQCSGEELKNSLKQAAQWREEQFHYDGAGNFYAKIRNNQIGKFEYNNETDTYIFKLTELFVQAQTKKENVIKNQIIRNFDICMLFDQDGNYITWCPAEEN